MKRRMLAILLLAIMILSTTVFAASSSRTIQQGRCQVEIVSGNVIYYDFRARHPSTGYGEPGSIILQTVGLGYPDERTDPKVIDVDGQKVYISPVYDRDDGFSWGHVVVDMVDTSRIEFSSYQFFPNKSRTGDGYATITFVRINR